MRRASIVKKLVVVGSLIAAILVVPAASPAWATTTVTFATVGTASFIVPAGVTSITIDASGSEGSAGVGDAGGKGGKVVATVAATPGETLQVRVGGWGGNATNPGFNGGATGGAATPPSSCSNCQGGRGGGASDVRRGPFGLANRIVTAGGGGGAAGGPGNPAAAGGPGGHAGGDGANGPSGCGVSACGGKGGANGGAGGTGCSVCPNGASGSAGQGGIGGAGVPIVGNGAMVAGGGGGGGQVGGGGGEGCCPNSDFRAAGGGGGSSATIGSATGVTFTDGVRLGNGVVTISYVVYIVLTASTVGTGTDAAAAAGTLNSSPAGVTCARTGGANTQGDCSEPYPIGTVVTLTATPGIGSTAAISGGCVAAAGAIGAPVSCTVAMSAAKAVVATFRRNLSAPPTIAKSFGAPTAPLGTPVALTFTLINPNSATPLSGIAFTDSLPPGLVVANPNGLSTTCGGTVTATAGASTVSLVAGTIASGASCAISIKVVGTTAGGKNNVTGVVSAAHSTAGAASNTAKITIVAPAIIAKAFGAKNIMPDGSTSLTFAIGNPAVNTVTLTGVGFTDTLPPGITVSNPNGLTGACPPGTITAVAGSNVVSLAGATLAPGATCTFGVNVIAAIVGTYTNVTGPVTSANGGNGNVASATIIVGSGIGPPPTAQPPSISKSFHTASIALHGHATLTFTINNPNSSTTLTGINVADGLPAGLIVSVPNGLTGGCGAGIIAAVAGSNTVSLFGGSVTPLSSCTFSINVTGIVVGTQVNTTSPVRSTEGGDGNAATASIVVSAIDLTVHKHHLGDFRVGQTRSYTIVVKNVGSGTAGGGVRVSDRMPRGMTVASMSGAGWRCSIVTITCIRFDALLGGTSYPAVVLTVHVGTRVGPVTNIAYVFGGRQANFTNDYSHDKTMILPAVQRRI